MGEAYEILKALKTIDRAIYHLAKQEIELPANQGARAILAGARLAVRLELDEWRRKYGAVA